MKRHVREMCSARPEVSVYYIIAYLATFQAVSLLRATPAFNGAEEETAWERATYIERLSSRESSIGPRD